MKYFITRMLDTVGLYRLACKIRGFHVGLKLTGYCLKCGKTSVPKEINQRAVSRTIDRPTQLRTLESIRERNDRIRKSVKAYGL
jgi:hypothetical protein